MRDGVGLLGPPSSDAAECVPPDRVAALFGKSKSWVYTMARQGHIPCVRVGGSWLFPRRALERWLEGASDVETAVPRGRVDSVVAVRRRRVSARRYVVNEGAGG